jgi:hypothetical protein
MNKIIQTIKKFELELLKPEVRKNKKRLGELLDTDFIEFTSIGTIIKKKNVLRNLPKENQIKWKVFGFKVKNISNDVVLVTYKVEKTDLKSKKIISSLRSSIWKKSRENWQIVFHQGTLIK